MATNLLRNHHPNAFGNQNEKCCALPLSNHYPGLHQDNGLKDQTKTKTPNPLCTRVVQMKELFARCHKKVDR